MSTKGNKNRTVWTAKDVYEMLYSTYGRSHAKAIAARKKEASKYTIPYIPEKEIMLTTGRYNTGKISTNLLDSIYNAAQRTNIPIDIALGLAGRESTLGIGRGFKQGQGVTATDLYSNWQQVQPIPNTNAQVKKYNEIVAKENAGEELSDEDYQYKSDFIIRGQNALESTKIIKENPIDNALKFYMTGKYNPGDKRHTQMVEEDARVLMSDPAIQKWLQTKTDNQMKCGGRRKAQLGISVTDGGTLTPIGKNIYLAQGRTHAQGGIGLTFGKRYNPAGDLEIEKNEIVEIVGGNNVKFNGNKKFKGGGQEASLRVFSSVPLLRGVSPAQLVMAGYDTDTVFKAQEEYKDKNRINDDGTRYEVGGEKIINYENLPSSFKGRRINGRILQGGIPPILSKGAGLTRGNFIQRMGMWNDDLGEFTKYIARRIHKFIPKKVDTAYRYVVDYLSNKGPNNAIDNNAENLTKAISLFNAHEYKTGGIHIKPSKRGTFTAAAKKRGMDVQEFASKVLANKEDYSTAMVKKANFARNASRWKKEYGGSMIYTINGNVKNGLGIRPKAKYGKIDRKDKDTKVGPDGLIYKRDARGEWWTDGTKHVTSEPIKENSSVKQGNTKASREGKLKTIPVSRVYLGWEDDDEEKETKKIGSLTYEKNEAGQWVPSSNQSISSTRSGNRPENFGMTRVGVNHPNGNYKYHPMTGERLDETGVVETSEPSVKGTTKVSSRTSSTPRGRGTKAPTSKAATKKEADTKYNTPLAEKKESLYMTGIKNNIKTPIRAAMKRIDTSSTGGGTQSKTDGRWIGQYKTTNAGDWIGLGSNIGGAIASYLISKRGIDNMPMPQKPIMAPAAKLKTRYNINAPLSEINQGTQLMRALIRRNTQSSNTSLAREQRAMNQAINAKNELYGKKENIETQWINQDRINRQTVAMQNVKTYNDYLNRVGLTRQVQAEAKLNNINNLISGLTGGVTNILNTIDSRRATNNTLRVIAAANPNVDARLIGGFDYYIDPITKKKYNKNQQYVGTING